MTAPDAPIVLPVAASTGVRELLRGPVRPVRVVATFPAAVYLAHDGGTIALVTTDGVHHPNALVVAAPAAARPLHRFRVHQHGHLGAGTLELASHRLRITRWFDPVPRLPVCTGAAAHLAVAARVAAAGRQLRAATGPVPATLTAGADALVSHLADDDVAGAVAAARGLVGFGPGLTPAGDDVVAGLLGATLALDRALHGGEGSPLGVTTRRAGERIAVHAADATTAVSAGLLTHAARGEVCGPAGVLLRALAGRGDVRSATARTLTVGATSGRDLTVGILAGAALALATASATSGTAGTAGTAAAPTRSSPLAAPDPRTS